MKKYAGLLILVLLALAVIFMKWEQPVLETVSLVVGESVVTVEIADDPLEQIEGLSNRDSLCPTCGMLFVFAGFAIQNFWMKDMKFPLDIIFIREGRIVEIVQNVPAPVPDSPIPTVRSNEPANMVLELNAEATKRLGIRVGDSVVVK